MDEFTIAQLRQQLDSGALTACELTQRYLDRIAAIDRDGPRLNSVIELNPAALSEAATLDHERAEGRPLGPLHGIPILLKDNIDTAGPMLTTAGSLALVEAPAGADAFIVQRLRRAGALILGKTNLSEWANFRSTHSSSGWSSRGGQTCNPYALDRNPSGSSSGSAVAVAANLCAAAVGSETNGSIISPAQSNGLVGIKPTVGLVSRTGLIPIAHSQDTAGPMARTVADAAALLGVLAGPDPRDAVTLLAPDRAVVDYAQYFDPDGARGMRIGVARNFFGFSERVDQVMAECLDVLRGLGAEIVDPANLDTAAALGEPGLEVLLYEFKAGLNTYLAGRGPGVQVHSLTELIEFNERHRAQVMPYFGQEHMLQAEAKGPLTEEKYLHALAECRRLSREAGLDAVMREHRLDALVAPSGGPAWLTDWINGDHYSGGSSSPAAVAGYPNITVPAGHNFGLPVGISFMGSAYQEPKLLRLAHAFEQATQARRPPTFAPSVVFEE
jgi:amidase